MTSQLFNLDHCIQAISISKLYPFAFSLSKNESLLDNRDIGTRRHDGVLFIIPRYSHYKYPQNPNFKVMKLWNRLPTKIPSINTKDAFKLAIKKSIINPFAKEGAG